MFPSILYVDLALTLAGHSPVVLTEGFEPPTYGLRVRSSTAELSKHSCVLSLLVRLAGWF